MTVQPRTFLTPCEVAGIMRVSKMTVYRLIHSGELEANRVGKQFRVDERDVTAFLRDTSTTADLPHIGGAA